MKNFTATPHFSEHRPTDGFLLPLGMRAGGEICFFLLAEIWWFGFQPDPLFSLSAQRKERGEKRKPLRFNSLETGREMS